MLLMLLLASALSGTERQEEIRSLSRHPWARWKPGSSVTIESVGSRLKIKQVRVLKEISKTAVSTGDADFFNDKGGREKINAHPLGLDYAPVDPTAKKTGEEKLTVAGKEYACEVWEVAIPGKSPKERKVWVSAEFPLPLRVVEVSKAQFGAYYRVLTAIALNEKVEAAGKSFSCVRLEGVNTFTSTGKKTGWTRWLSLDVPGGVVKEERRPQGKRPSVSIVTAFEAKK